MNRENIEQIVTTFLIEELETELSTIRPDALLKDDLGIDSLDFVDIVVLVERNFGFKIKPEDMAGVNTLADFYAYIESRLAAK
ncbi:MAG: phosphopantetheine-binding protein [Tannerellaceae bacterium]|jgi:acyl carrier protein|nr:phosphopantetheine-binding protein [Tannerellaceae bacterium]